jgi:8-oxo-(d)GTP phosphatase
VSGERILAGGGLLWRPGPAGDIEVCLVHRPKYDDWSLPKGKLEPGEHVLTAAVREVREETGVHAVVGRRLPTQEYRLGEDRKVVEYWSMTPAGGAFEADHEVDSLLWLPVAEAAARLTYDRDRAFLLTSAALPAETATVLLVRHAKAGSRSKWHGEDTLRPLDPSGRAQAEGLRRALRWFAPTAVAAADPLRCVQTVGPLAADLGLPVEPAPALAEDAYDKDPDAGLRALETAAAAGGRTVLCSQGGVIPDLVRRLATRDGVRPGRRSGTKIPSRKASVWALTFSGPALTAADYYPDLPKAPEPQAR